MAKKTDRRLWRILFPIFIIAFLASRLVVLWVSPKIFQGAEEKVNGVLALHMQNGLVLPVSMYQYEHYAGGSMVVGLVAAPFFKLFGPTYFSLKLAPLLFSLCLLITLLLLTRKWFGSPAWIILGVLYLFAPAFFIERSLVAYGNHMEVGLFYALSLACLYFTSKPAQSAWIKNPVAFFAFGLTCGFGVFFDYQFLLFAPVLIFFSMVSFHSFKQVPVTVLLFYLGFKIGFAPWQMYHGDSEFLRGAWHFYLNKSAMPDTTGLLELVYQMVGSFFKADLTPWMGSFDLWWGNTVILEGETLNRGLYRIFLVSYIFLAIRARHAAWDFIKAVAPVKKTRFVWQRQHYFVPLLAYVPIHFLVYALYAANYEMPAPPFRYLHPVFILYFLIIALAASELWAGKTKPVTIAVTTLAALLAFFGALGLLAEPVPGKVVQLEGYAYNYFYGSLQTLYTVQIDNNLYLNQGEKYFPQNKQDYYAGVCLGVAALNGQDLSGHLRFYHQKGPDAERAFFTGLGCALMISGNLRPDQKQTLDDLVPAEFFEAFENGKGLGTEMKRAFHGLK